MFRNSCTEIQIYHLIRFPSPVIHLKVLRKIYCIGLNLIGRKHFFLSTFSFYLTGNGKWWRPASAMRLKILLQGFFPSLWELLVLHTRLYWPESLTVGATNADTHICPELHTYSDMWFKTNKIKPTTSSQMILSSAALHHPAPSRSD